MQSFSHLLMASIFLIIILQCAESVIVFLEFYFPDSYMTPETQNLHLSVSIGTCQKELVTQYRLCLRNL